MMLVGLDPNDYFHCNMPGRVLGAELAVECGDRETTDWLRLGSQVPLRRWLPTLGVELDAPVVYWFVQ